MKTLSKIIALLSFTFLINSCKKTDERKGWARPAQSVQVFGNDVFIAGNAQSSSGNSQASYCKNGKLVLLDNTGFSISVANSIFVTE
ncbi:MAG: hypothetical protein IPI88_05080 [Chitinophagaceae bacterium]|nr:hypothetical protein [Chitinophagaceae bacterium]